MTIASQAHAYSSGSFSYHEGPRSYLRTYQTTNRLSLNNVLSYLLFYFNNSFEAASTTARSQLRNYFSAYTTYIALILHLLNTSICINLFCGNALADDTTGSTIFTQNSIIDSPLGPKQELRDIGVAPDVWVTQYYQGIVDGDQAGISRYGGKIDGFLTLQPEKLTPVPGILPGLQVDAQYEHYFGLNINQYTNAGLPVNTQLAYVNSELYHSTLSLTVKQKLNDNLSITAGKFNNLTAAAQTPLVGGGGLTTFMNRAFALPSTDVAFTSMKGGPEDRVVLAPPYTLGTKLTYKTDPLTFNLVVADPRSAIDPEVIEKPFQKGVSFNGSITLETKFAGLQGYHTVGFDYSNARGVDLADLTNFNAKNWDLTSNRTKKGYWVTS